MAALPPSPFLGDAPDVTYTAPEPFTPGRIADMLRGEPGAVAGSILLVEGIDIIRAPFRSGTHPWRTVRLLLGDGDLSIQALLATEMHRYVDSRDLIVGSYIRLGTARLQWSNPSAGDPDDSMVCLIVHDFAMVGWNNKLLSLMVGAEASHVVEEMHEVAVVAGQQEVLDGATAVGSKPTSPARVSETQSRSPARPTRPRTVEGPRARPQGATIDGGDSDDGEFETMAGPETRPAEKRAGTAALATTPASAASDPAWLSTDLSKPLKLTPLRSIPNLPYKQNWSVNVLAIVSSITELQPATLPPFSQRQARLAHPSTPKLVHLTVFLDPADFTPQVGSAVLLLGVKNHRFDGGSLKKYSSDRPRDGGPWWLEDPAHLSWCDVDSLTRWWDLRLR